MNAGRCGGLNPFAPGHLEDDWGRESCPTSGKYWGKVRWFTEYLCGAAIGCPVLGWVNPLIAGKG